MPPQTPPPASPWTSSTAATLYKAAEAATRPFASLMLSKSNFTSSLAAQPAHVFDLACGTGAVEAEIFAAVPREQWNRVSVLAGDVSEPMLGYLGQRVQEEGWEGLVETKVVDGSKLGESGVGIEGGFTHVFVGFGIFVMPPGTVGELSRMVRPGGVVGVSTWARLPWFEFLVRTYERLEDGPVLPTEEQLWNVLMKGGPWYTSEYVRERLEEVGLERVEVVQRTETVDCGNPDNFMTTMGFVMDILGKQWEEGKRDRWSKEVKETMKSIVTETAGGADKHLFLDFEGIVGVGWKGE